MAQKVDVQLIDDLDGGPAAETVVYMIDGNAYEIDLSEKNAQELRDGFADYITASRRSVARVKRGPKSASANGNKQLSESIRNWAREQGMQISDRGRIKAEIVTAYHERPVV